MEQPKDVEQATRCGTKIRSALLVRALKKKTGVAQDVQQPQFVEQLHTVEQRQSVEQPKDVEHATRGGTKERSAILVRAKKKRMSLKMWNNRNL